VATDATGVPYAIAADTAYVYWVSPTTPETIRRYGLTTHVEDKVLTEAASDSTVALLADGTSLYGMQFGVRVWGSAKASPTTLTPIAGVTINEYPRELFQIGTNLYWASIDGFAYSAISGGAASKLPSIGALDTTHFAIDDSYIHWIDVSKSKYHKVSLTSTGNYDFTVTLPVAAMATFATNSSYVFAIGASDPMYVKVLDKTDGSSTYGAPMNLSAALADLAKIVVTQTYVYWTDAVAAGGNCGTNFNVLRAAVGTPGQPAVVATVAGCPLLVAGPGAVYFTDGKKIYRMPDP
jgi:hypothetical protein